MRRIISLLASVVTLIAWALLVAAWLIIGTIRADGGDWTESKYLSFLKTSELANE